MAITDAGETKAWETLAACDPAGVCARAGAAWDRGSGSYRLSAFGHLFSADPATRELANLDPEGALFLQRLGYFFRLSAIWYLVRAGDSRPSGKLVKPAGLPGGDLFYRGSHTLPLDAVAKKYAADREGFLAAGARRGGVPAAYGDAAVVLPAFPKVPVTVILWNEDDEFPARAELLFDATAPAHLPLDLLWSVAMMSLLSLV